jgi:hypothetical protein
VAAVAETARAANIPVSANYHEIPCGGKQPADLFFHTWPTHPSTPLVVDVTVVTPMQMDPNIDTVRISALHQVSSAERNKRNKHNAEVQANFLNFAPMAISSFGPFGNSAKGIVRTIKWAYIQEHGVSPRRAHVLIHGFIQASVMRHTARTLRHAVQRTGMDLW